MTKHVCRCYEGWSTYECVGCRCIEIVKHKDKNQSFCMSGAQIRKIRELNSHIVCVQNHLNTESYKYKMECRRRGCRWLTDPWYIENLHIIFQGVLIEKKEVKAHIQMNMPFQFIEKALSRYWFVYHCRIFPFWLRFSCFICTHEWSSIFRGIPYFHVRKRNFQTIIWCYSNFNPFKHICNFWYLFYLWFIVIVFQLFWTSHPLT